jgi:hypothetical protein
MGKQEETNAMTQGIGGYRPTSYDCDRFQDQTPATPQKSAGLDYCKHADSVASGFLCDEPKVVSDACRTPKDDFDKYVCDDRNLAALQKGIWDTTKDLLQTIFGGSSGGRRSERAGPSPVARRHLRMPAGPVHRGRGADRDQLGRLLRQAQDGPSARPLRESPRVDGDRAEYGRERRGAAAHAAMSGDGKAGVAGGHLGCLVDIIANRWTEKQSGGQNRIFCPNLSGHEGT